MKFVINFNAQSNLYFLDSVTIGSTQAAKAAQGTNVKVLRRRVFLDDNQNENEIRHQFQRAIQLARKNSYVIAIGHPHPSTVRVLQEMLPTLPTDIRLARPSQVLGLTPMPTTNRPPSVEKNSFVAKLTQRCRARHALNAPKPADAVQLIYQSVKESQLVHTIRALFR